MVPARCHPFMEEQVTHTDAAARNLATTEALYAATASGNWPLAETMLCDDLVITEAETLPFAGTYTGKGALRDLYAKVLGTSLGQATIAVKNKMAAGNNVVYLLELVPPAGNPLELVEVFHFADDGRVSLIKPYYYNSAAVTAAVAAARG
ncbi:nuclear transport factor 2 family protein [Niveispirillum sp. SYP-B3756]|uniref:nuclear transport factor 2 family protein n=1 Tax=Niveispirillum sp. SYP-B3756 TaxID=2662178 RepID=UPI00129272C7|nr:nuclear transport factor 2 family protein [Niveispirillum sp. SYP-B3756]MQP64947.1 nuclear transport factor 2 family protein [Niveispirillum sp. SYP-B3756]